MSLEQVASIGTPTTFRGLGESIAKAQVMPKDLGGASTDLVFFPFAPCRYIDTRNVGGKISGARGFDFSLSGTSYGGSAGCSLTTLSGASENQIAAVALNMTIVDTSTAAAPGFATARPAGATQSTALVNWTASSAGFQLGNAAVITTDQSGALDEMEIFTSGPVHAIVDMAGVFAAPNATALSCNTVTGTVSVPVGSGFSLAQASCAAGFTRTGGGCNIPDIAGASILSTNPLSTTTWNCAFNQTGTGYTGTAYVLCCRTPGR